MIFQVIKFFIIILLMIFLIINIIKQYTGENTGENTKQNKNINSKDNLQNINSKNNLQNINSKNNSENITNYLISYNNPSNISCQIKTKSNLNLSFNINNLKESLYFTKNNIKFDIINNNNFIYIKTQTNPPFYINTDIDGKISLDLNQNKKGNKWILFKLNDTNIFKNVLINNNEIICNNFIKHFELKFNRLPNNFDKNDLENKINNKIRNNKLNYKYQYFYDNGLFIKSKDYDYFISKNNNYIKCNLYPSINDIFFFYN